MGNQLVVHKATALALVVLFASGCHLSSPTTTRPDDAQSIAGDRVWREIRHPAGLPTPATEPDDEFIALWHSGRALWRLAASPTDHEGLRYVLAQFGRFEPEADLRLLFGFPALMLPVAREQQLKPWNLPERYLGMPEKEVYRVRLRVCRYQTEYLFANPEQLSRYTQAVFWSGALMAGYTKTADALSVGVGKVMDAGDPDEYWWAARNFLILACATGRMDLLKGAAIDKLKERYQLWRPWFGTHRENLVFDLAKGRWTWRFLAPWLPEANLKGVPALPFPNWVGPPPNRALVLQYISMDGTVMDMSRP